MRPSCRFLLTIRVALYTILIGLFVGATSRASDAQATSTLPKPWNDATARLADEVAAALSPTSVTLDVENISSLDDAAAATIEAAIRAQLQRHSFSLAPENAAAQSAIRLQLSLSESVAEYVWVIQILNDQSSGTAAPLMIVAAPKVDFADAGAEARSLSLEKRFVWKQPGKFLDFALLKDSISGESILLVLETDHFAVYKPSGAGWQLFRTSPLPQATPPSRDAQGTIMLKEGKISLQGFECFGDSDLAGVLRCNASKPIQSVGTDVAQKCRGEFVFLFTAEGDWTQPDSISGRLTKGIPLPLVPSGNTLEFDGPVMALHSGPEDSSVRAILHNLKSGEYEAYVVTATCNN